MERVRNALREGEASGWGIEAYTGEATSRRYNRQLFTAMTRVCLRWKSPSYTTYKG